MDIYMVQNIFVGVLCVIVLAAGVWSWWVDNRGSFEKEEKTTVEECEECNNEKN